MRARARGRARGDRRRRTTTTARARSAARAGRGAPARAGPATQARTTHIDRSGIYTEQAGDTMSDEEITSEPGFGASGYGFDHIGKTVLYDVNDEGTICTITLNRP